MRDSYKFAKRMFWLPSPPFWGGEGLGVRGERSLD